MAPPEVKIDLKPPLNNDFYSTNDRICGSVKIQLKKALSIKTINVILKGFTETLTKVDPINCYGQHGMMMPVQDNRSYHTLFSYTERVFPPNNVWDAIEGSSKPFKMKPGHYEYEFAFAKIPRQPKCLANHTKGLVCFSRPDETRMPPSYNNLWRDQTKIDNLDLYFYSYGKVLYMVQVQMELGKANSWYKPFNKLVREIQLIEFIPDARDLAYEEADEKEEPTNRRQPSTQEVLREEMSGDFNMSPLRWDNDTMTGSVSGNDQTRIYKSSFWIGLPDHRSSVWVEVRSRGLRETYRNDELFCAGSRKFDRVYLVARGDIAELRKWTIVPTKIQLNLLEIATYLSQGVANENFSSLRLASVDNLSKTSPSLLDFENAKVTADKNGSKEGQLECEIKLRNHPMLKRLKFNEEDYRHRGNRLYSFKTCTIKRVFNFQLLIDWDINGTSRQTEVIIRPMQIFVQTRDNLRNDILPKYIEPPVYSEAAEIAG
ncbi:hypothetical protein HG536_0E01720 [Torulaspora globosa]|uniref:Arrestin-like N-terminal domain-containing protein n=1 Tax=Torulaspora globosa TaxID=48254 RepID=A0A7G3ZIC5_9SACH|nr:uncharacterized protein HG536_0E01720 [Torulaspora globosa]QLL33261.1 hypothetical protein HG536_0E01720 [Torulaspora globosa]